MDFSGNAQVESAYVDADGILLVYFRYMVRLGILLLYRMALGSKKAFGLPRPARVLYSFSAVENYRRQFQYGICGENDTHFFSAEFGFKHMAEWEGLVIEKERKETKLSQYHLSSLICIYLRKDLHGPIFLVDEAEISY